MGKYGFSTAIPYGTDIFEVTGTEYCEWEDALERANGDSDAMEWNTYDFLINNGYLVSAPSSERPATGGDKEKSGSKGSPKNKPSGSDLVGGAVSSPGILGVPDGFTLIEGNTREPTWTQSRILAERDKLLKERERIQEIKEKKLEQKIVEQQLLERLKQKERGSPLSFGSFMSAFYIGIAVFFIMIVMLVAFLQGFKGH
jgi:hypothetical protein